MDIKESLASFYDHEAEKYYQTRNKHWNDADIFLDEIKNSGKKTIHILEFGCGSGRLLAQLIQLKNIKIVYTGIDISKELLKYAKKQLSKKTDSKHIQATFICADIVEYIKGLKQESFDFVVGAASFQHIPTTKERFFLIKNCYRILRYEGKLIMTNRSLSHRFIKKYTKQMAIALWKHIFTFGASRRNDLQLPRKNKGKTYSRFYHLYTIKELNRIVSLSGFIINDSGYLQKGKKIDSRKNAENTFIVGEKRIFLKNDPD